MMLFSCGSGVVDLLFGVPPIGYEGSAFVFVFYASLCALYSFAII